MSQLTANEQQSAIYALVDQWPMDLFIDYILKIHHRGIRTEGPALTALFQRVLAQQPDNERLLQVYGLFVASLEDLEMHLMKEENVLFPFLLDLFEAAQSQQPIGQMHCGSVANPIHVMENDHAGEIRRYARIAELTDDFACPADATADYSELMTHLQRFMAALHEHITLENDHLFPAALRLEEAWVGY